jgi:serine/threonine-protein kinase
MDFFDPASLVVGRGDDVGLQLLEDPYFSRHHFQLEFDPPRCRLRDLGSSNGTLVNGRRVMDCFLCEGDEISGGQTTIRFSELNEPVTTVPLGHDDFSETRPLGTLTTIPVQQETLRERLPLLRPPGYEIKRLIGEGGMGTVYLARRNSDGREVALKLVMPESALGPLALTLFLREVSVLSQLDHPRIIRFHEIGEAQGQFYIVMEYVPAIDLRVLMDRASESERVALACSVIADALDGLGYAHDRGIVHRDFKPSNLLVNWEEGLPSVKVADFGLAKRDHDGSARAGNTFLHGDGTSARCQVRSAGGRPLLGRRHVVFFAGRSTALSAWLDAERTVPDRRNRSGSPDQTPPRLASESLGDRR